MNESGAPRGPRAADVLRRESDLIREAVLLVASGESSRVTVTGLAFGEAMVEVARALAAEHDVLIEPQWTTDESGASVTVSRVAAGG